MMPRACRQALAALAALASVVLVDATTAAQDRDTADYVVNDYTLTVELTRGTWVARVTMDLTYQVFTGKKSEGFKYIANLEPFDLRGIEADGTPMQMSVEHQRETLIRWRFRPSGPGEKRVTVSFSIPAALTGTKVENTFSASWAGIFKVPVRHAIYRLVMPEDWRERDVSVSPRSLRAAKFDGRLAYEVEQRPLTDQSFTVTLRPGIVDAAPLRAVGDATAPAPVGRRTESWRVENVLLFVGVFAIIVIAIAAATARRGKRGFSGRSGRNDGGGYLAGSCAGGSSCSSSCGGGGCGGGCGG